MIGRMFLIIFSSLIISCGGDISRGPVTDSAIARVSSFNTYSSKSCLVIFTRDNEINRIIAKYDKLILYENDIVYIEKIDNIWYIKKILVTDKIMEKS